MANDLYPTMQCVICKQDFSRKWPKQKTCGSAVCKGACRRNLLLAAKARYRASERGEVTIKTYDRSEKAQQRRKERERIDDLAEKAAEPKSAVGNTSANRKSILRRYYETRKRQLTNPGSRERTRRNSRKAYQFVQSFKLLSKLEVIMKAVESNGHIEVASSSLAGHMAELHAIDAELNHMSNDDLRDFVERGLRLVRDQLMKLGRAVLILDSRGVELDGDQKILNLLRQIGRGEVLADVVVRFAGRPVTMSCVKAFPVEKQQELLNLTDTEIDEMFRKRVNRTATDPSCKAAIVRPTEMAKNATVGDLVEMIMDMVAACKEPARVAAQLIPELEKVVSKSKRPAVRKMAPS